MDPYFSLDFFQTIWPEYKIKKKTTFFHVPICNKKLIRSAQFIKDNKEELGHFIIDQNLMYQRKDNSNETPFDERTKQNHEIGLRL